MGVFAFFIDELVESLILWKWEVTKELLRESVFSAWTAFLFLSVLFGGSAAAMTVFIGPGAMGSGIAELMGYFNGIHLPGLIGVALS